MSTDIIDLEFLGLTSKESLVYQTLLREGSAGARLLSELTKFDRTTVYDITENLIKKGLVFKHKLNRILTFSAHDPKQLLTRLKQKELQLQEILPALVQSFKTNGKLPTARIYTGKDQLTLLYESILEQKQLHTYDIICSEKDWLQMNPTYFRKYKNRRAQKGIHTRMIVETSDMSISRKNEQSKTLSEVKLLPPAFSPLSFSAGCYILPERVIFVSYRKEHVATELYSKEISSFMQTIFNLLWKTLT